MSRADGLSHQLLLTGKMGRLTPLGLWPVLPGAHWRGRAFLDIQMQALVRPVLHNIKYTVHYWFVPLRLIWSDWENYITGGEDGTFTAVEPYFVSDGANNAKGSLSQHFGRSGDGMPNLHLSIFGHRCYTLISNTWYRNQNVAEPAPLSLASGEDTTTNMDFLYRTWKPNDYFTNALPFLQRGEQVALPIDAVTSSIPVVGTDEALVVRAGLSRRNGQLDLFDNATSTVKLNDETDKARDGLNVTNDKTKTTLRAVTEGGLYEVLVSTLRQGLAKQHVMERLARSGGRYVEYLMAMFNIRSSDARLQRPEFLGGGSKPFVISKVLQTSATETDGTPQANPAGYGQTMSITPSFDKVFEEHGFIMPILSIMPESTYCQGIDRVMMPKTRWDWPVPEFARIGDQAILNKELYVSGDSGVDNGIFGYTPRYEEYHKMPSRYIGEFVDSLDYWHLGRKFENTPTLSQQFCECHPDEERIFAVEGQDNFLIQCYHDLDVAQPLPRVREPGLSYV